MNVGPKWIDEYKQGKRTVGKQRTHNRIDIYGFSGTFLVFLARPLDCINRSVKYDWACWVVDRSNGAIFCYCFVGIFNLFFSADGRPGVNMNR